MEFTWRLGMGEQCYQWASPWETTKKEKKDSPAKEKRWLRELMTKIYKTWMKLRGLVENNSSLSLPLQELGHTKWN